MEVSVTAKEDQGADVVLLEVGSYTFDTTATNAWGLKIAASVSTLAVVSSSLF